MCIAFPGKILSIGEDNIAVVDISGTRRMVSLDILDEEARIGAYVITHAGFAIHKVDEDVAREDLALLKELMESDSY